MVAEWVLAVATSVLAWATWNLFRATRQLEKIEATRERRENRQRKFARVDRKIKLAEQIVRVDPDVVRQSIVGGHVPNPEAQYIREIVSLVEYGKDQVRREDVDRLLLAFDNVSRGGHYTDDSAKDVIEAYKRVQERLGWDFARCHQELLDLAEEIGRE